MSTMTVRQLLDALRPIDQSLPIVYGFCALSPTKPDSWRGVYSELALGYSREPDGPGVTVAEVVQWLTDTYGSAYTGYKGGDFIMGPDTEVWVDNWGQYTRTSIAGITADEYEAVIQTEAQP